MDKKIETSGKNKIYRKLAKQLAGLGFERTKTTFYTRPKEYVVEFIHLHKFTFCPGFRVHFGIRVLNDSSDGPALNGPMSPDRLFSYGESEHSLEKCANEIHKFCRTKGERWFKKWANQSKLAKSKKSPLHEKTKRELQDSIEGKLNVENIKKSKVILGIT